MDQEIQAARDKLATRFANATQIGGKGKRPRSNHFPGIFLSHGMTVMLNICMYRHPEKKEEACYRAECQWGQEA